MAPDGVAVAAVAAAAIGRAATRTAVRVPHRAAGEGTDANRNELFAGEQPEHDPDREVEAVAEAASLWPRASEPAVESAPTGEDIDRPPVAHEPEPVREWQPAREAAVEPVQPHTNGAAETPAAESTESPPKRDFEIVNEPPQAPRRGWWKRLTE